MLHQKANALSRLVILCALFSCLISCTSRKNYTMNAVSMSGLRLSDFQHRIDGKQTSLFVLKNESGMEVCITNYGARVVSLMTKDKNGDFDDIVLGFSSIHDYLNAHEVYHGATVGRYANRIANGRFSIDGTAYNLARNNGPNSLHGGPGGLHNVVWDVVDTSQQTVQLSYISPDGEEGFPGNLSISLKYELSDEDELMISYTGETDKKTVINLSHHSFFNLTGQHSNKILDHQLFIDANYYTPVDRYLIPTGIKPVENTPFDFNQLTPIGTRINQGHEQLSNGAGYDHNFVLNKTERLHDEIFLAARVVEPLSRREMSVYTNEPGIQFYSGNFMNGQDVGKKGIPHVYRSAFCLETQHFPDSPNNPDFPSTLIEPGITYNSVCIYKFGVI